MLELESVHKELLDLVEPCESSELPLGDSLGLYLSRSVKAKTQVPPVDVSAVDGFGVSSRWLSGSATAVRAKRHEESALAGSPRMRLETWSEPIAMPVMTGAPVPLGVDLIVMVEDVTDDGGSVNFPRDAASSRHIRSAGSTIEPGALIAQKSDRVTARLIGLLATAGVNSVQVTGRPKVAVVSVGDELVDVSSAELGQSEIYDSNRPALIARLSQLGCEVVDYGILPDSQDAVKQVIGEAALDVDLVVTSGSISMGESDVVKKAFINHQSFHWCQLAIKPGKPFMFGCLAGAVVVCLPGNNVSSLVSFELLVRAVVAKLGGARDSLLQTERIASSEEISKLADGKTHYLRGIISRDGLSQTVSLLKGQGSHQIAQLAAADCLVVIPDGLTVSEGQSVDVIRL